MASFRRGRRSTTEQTITRFILNASFLINHNPLLLLGLCFQALYAAIQYLVLLTTQTGSIVCSWRNLVAEKDSLYSSEVHDGDVGNPYVFSSGKSDLKSAKSSIEIDDPDFAFENESVENTAHIPHVKNRRFDLQDEISLLGIEDIVPLLANCGTKNLNKAAAKKKKDIGFFPGFAVPSFWTAGESGILTNKGTDLGDEDVNFHVSLTGKTMKVPEEHTCFDWLLPETLKLKTTSRETEEPSDAETTQDNSSDSSQKGGQAIPDSGKPAAQVSKSQTGSNNYSRSSSGSGGDDGDDGQRQNVPAGGCQGDSQCSVDDSEEHEQQAEEQSHQGGGCPRHQDSMSIPTEVPSNTGNGQDKTTTSNQIVGQTATDGGKQAGQVSKTQQGSTNYRRSSSGSGGDDGGEDRKRNVPTGGCQGDGQCDVDDLEESEQDGDQEEKHSLPQTTDSISVGELSRDSTNSKKSSGQGLRMDVSGARMITQALYELAGLPVKSQEAACQSFQSDQFNFQCPEAGEIEHNAAEKRLQQAFICCRNLNCEREWHKCEESSCQEIQGFLDHSQNCRLRVLGGCETCIQYKNILLYHASRCHLPLGQCVVPKCDYIREYAKKSSIPANRKWQYEHDQLFFRCSPPTTPTTPESQPSFAEATPDYHELMKHLVQAKRHGGAHSLSAAYLTTDRSSTSFSEESSRDSSGAWNQYHVDRPPDLQVTRGPTVTEHVKFQHQEDDVLAESVAPLSATCLPVRVTCQTAESTAQKEWGEVIWPLNTEKLSVDEDGTYLEGIHWRNVRSIGGGSCGRCFYCTDLKTGFCFAIKKVPVEKFESAEIEIWGSLSEQHPNILELYGAVKYKQTVIIFMEYMKEGSVEEYAGRMHELLAVHIFGKVVSAVEFMHSQNILHRDIKGANVLLDDSGQQVKLADFGTSIRCDRYQQDNVPKGTEAFMAPEVCRSEHHSFSADIWSLMCFLHQLLVGEPPWMEFRHYSLIYLIGMADKPPKSPPCSPEVEDLFSQGFILEPSARATAAELLQHHAFVKAPSVSNIPFPSREETELDSDEFSSLGSNMRGSDTESLVSKQSTELFMSGCVAGNHDGNEEEEMDNDDDNDIEASDGYDDSSSDLQEPDILGAEAAMFIERPWQGLDLSAEEQLQSLQSELVLSLEGEDLERVLHEIEENTDVNDNDINLLNAEDFNVGQFIGQLLGDADMASTQPLSGAFATPEWSYSITDLTKLHIKDSKGNLVFTIRERPSTSYGSLGEEHHGNIASVLKLDAFSLTREDGTPLNARAEIGSEEQAVRVVRAHDTDNWQPYRWRVDIYGRVEQFFEI